MLVPAPFFVETKADDLLLLLVTNDCGCFAYNERTNACDCSCFLVEMKADDLLVLTTNACGGCSYFLG